MQDRHLTETALKAASQRRQQNANSGEQNTTPKAPTVLPAVYPQDAALQAIRRFAPKAPYAELGVCAFD